MKRRYLSILGILLGCFVATGVFSNDFFGISLSTPPKENVCSILKNLLSGDREQAEQHREDLSSSLPKLALGLRISELEVPCVTCTSRKNPACPFCGGNCFWLDPDALRYIQKTLDALIQAGIPLEKAWAQTRQQFEVRKALVLSRTDFKGCVVRFDSQGVLIKNLDETVFFLAANKMENLKAGLLLEGYCWKIVELSHSYQDSEGYYKSVPFYTQNLWWDY